MHYILYLCTKIIQKLFCFKYFKIEWFPVFNENLVWNVLQTCLKGFKLKKLVVEPKTAQPIELDEELIDPQLNQSSGAKKNLLYSRMVVQPVKGEQEPVDPHLNQSRSDQGAVEVQWSPVKH